MKISKLFKNKAPAEVMQAVTSITEPVSVHPNPTTKSATVLLSSMGQHYIEVTDTAGAHLRWIPFIGKQYKLSLEDLKTGLYFIRAFDREGNVIGRSKIVVQ